MRVDSPCGDCGGACFVRLAEQPIMQEFTADGVWVGQIAIAKAGSFVPQHSHRYDHLTMLATGRVRVSQDGRVTGEHSAPSAILIAANVKHIFETLTDDVVLYCIHRDRGAGPEVVETHEVV